MPVRRIPHASLHLRGRPVLELGDGAFDDSGAMPDWLVEVDRGSRPVHRGFGLLEMVEYPSVYEHGGTRHMLCNGNGFGLSFGHVVEDG